MDGLPRVNGGASPRRAALSHRLGAAVLVGACASLAACAHAPEPLPLRRAAPLERVWRPELGGPVALGSEETRVALARGVLTYALAFAGPERLLAVELDTAFSLRAYARAPDADADADADAGARERDDRPRATAAPSWQTRWRSELGPADYDVVDIAVDHARDQVFVAVRDGTVRGYAIADGALVSTWHLGSAASAVAISADGDYAATGSEDGVVCLRRREDGALLQCALAHAGAIAALAFSDGVLASAAWDGSALVWSIPSLAIRAKQHLPGVISDLAFAPAGARLALARSAAPLRRGVARSADAVSDHMDEGASADETAADGEPAPAVTVWDWQRDRQQHLRGHRGPVSAVAWSVDGAHLLSASWDRSVALWHVDSGERRFRIGGFDEIVRDLACSPDGAYVAVGAWTAPGARESMATSLIELLYAPSTHLYPAQQRPAKD